MPDFALLIVDDDEADRYILKRLIKSCGIDATIFEESDGRAALEFLTDYEANHAKYGEVYPPIIVFLDINMPRINGLEFLDKFSSLREERYEAVVFLMVTSSQDAIDKQSANKFDFVKGYIPKMPRTAEELKSTIEPYLPQV